MPPKSSSQNVMCHYKIQIVKKVLIFIAMIFLFACHNKKEMEGTYQKVSANDKNNISTLTFRIDEIFNGKETDRWNLCGITYKGKLSEDACCINEYGDTLTIISKQIYSDTDENYHDLVFKIIDENTLQCVNKEYPNLYLEVYKK
jgi:hypothetical protein